jgi:hypothetical protein
MLRPHEQGTWQGGGQGLLSGCLPHVYCVLQQFRCPACLYEAPAVDLQSLYVLLGLVYALG